MFQESEIITLVITLGIGFFLWTNRQSLHRLVHWKLLVMCYFCYLGGVCFTVLEDILWEDGLNLLEHTAYLLLSILFLIWCWQFSCHRENNQ